MRTRLIIVALIAFVLGVVTDRCVKFATYDRIITHQANRLELQDEMIQEQKAQLAEINAIPAKGSD